MRDHVSNTLLAKRDETVINISSYCVSGQSLVELKGKAKSTSLACDDVLSETLWPMMTFKVA